MTPTTPTWAAPFTLTLTPAQLSLLLTVLGLLVIAGLVAGFLRWTGTRKATGKNWTLSALDSFALLLSPVWIVLLFWVLYALWRVFDAFDPALAGSNLRWHVLAFVGLITALGALVTAPLALIRVYTTERQTRVAEQGHMTDRISKAVEQLGAEKTVKRRVTGPDGTETTVEETVPNIEVRIGGIYALERIAQDSMATDKGRDHIRVMELICAYIRENAPARGVEDHPFGPWEPLSPHADGLTRAQHAERRKERFGSDIGRGKAQTWAWNLPPPRTDIQTALTVVGRRTSAQIALERATDTPGSSAGYLLDLRNTCLRQADLSSLSFEMALFTHARMEGTVLKAAQIGGADISGAIMVGAVLSDTLMDAADLSGAQMEGAVLGGAQMARAYLSGVQMEGAYLSGASLEGANLYAAQLEGADLNGAHMEEADLNWAQMEGANLRDAHLEGANFADVQMEGATLRSADLARATNLTQTAINAAWGDSKTILPEAITRPGHWDALTLENRWATDPKYDAWLAAGAPPGKPVP